MSKLVDQWIDIFRAGDYTDKDKGSFTEQDLRQIADNYDPENHEAPIVIGHPKSDGPAYGWVDKLRVAGKLLQAKFKDVNPSFEKLLEQKSFKKRSVSLYSDAKGWSLRHVGFLGAQPPEIKGLADIKFEQEDEKAIEIEFSEEMEMAEKDNQSIIDGIWDRMKAAWGSAPGAPAPAKTFSEEDVKRIAAETATAAVSAAVAPLETRLKAQETSFSERETKLTTGETQARAAAAIAQVKSKGAWVPAFDKVGVPLLFDELAKATASVEFGEEGAKVQKAPLDILVAFMEGLGKIVPNAPVYTGQAAPAATTKTANFNETPQTPVDRNSVLFDEAIQQRMKESKSDYRTAMREIASERPELTQPGGSSAGAV